jgi:hypothetical protein
MPARRKDFLLRGSDHNDGVEGAKILADSEKKHCQCAMIDLNI